MKYALAVMISLWTALLNAENWPREVLSSEGTITIYQPQIDSYSGNFLKARAAISIIPIGENEPVFGAIWMDCRVFTDRPTRTVTIEDMEVRRIKFASGSETNTANIASILEEIFPRLDLTFSLDLLLVSVETAHKEREAARELEMKPPKFIVVNNPAILVRIDGDPILMNMSGSSLKRVVNTPFFLVYNPVNRKYYLRGNDIWFSSGNIKGSWYKLTNPPKAVSNLYKQMKFEEDFDDVIVTDDQFLKTKRQLQIIVSTEPAELISTDGPVQFIPVQGTNLLFASNSPNRLFFENRTKYYFILASGRWYTSNRINGPWIFIASTKLPADFRKIPPGSKYDDILAHIAGTIPAKEAIYDSQIPQMAEIDRSLTTIVDYDGDPEFESIENTGMEYAVNASSAVIRVNDFYYNCDRGVWFYSPNYYGPWTICIDVPEAIYSIPPRCPIYGVRYVRVYNYTPDIVYVGYTSGYTGCYIYNGAIVYGTGYNYYPWYKQKYYARPWTWGFNVHYDPWTGWSISFGWHRPHGWFAHLPKIRHTGWWGPADYRPAFRPITQPVYRDGYHPAYRPEITNASNTKTPVTARRTSGTQRSGTLYDNRGTSIRRPLSTGSSSTAGTTTRGTQTATPEDVSKSTTSPITPAQQPQPSRPSREAAPVIQKPEQEETTRKTPAPSPVRPIEPSRPSREPAVSTQPQPAAEPRITVRPENRTDPQPVRNTSTRTGQRITTNPSQKADNVYAAPDGTIMQTTQQGWQQREQNTWKDAPETPTKQSAVQDSEVRRRAAERRSPGTSPSTQSTKEETKREERKR